TLPSSAENAIEKQPACAAAMSSSGFVPMPSSKRALNEYCVSLSTPLSVEMLPLPPFKSPRQTADALRFNIIAFRLEGARIRSASLKLAAASLHLKQLDGPGSGARLCQSLLTWSKGVQSFAEES